MAVALLRSCAAGVLSTMSVVVGSEVDLFGTAEHEAKAVTVHLDAFDWVPEPDTIYTDHTLEGMKQLGIDDDKVSKCASKMHIATIKQLHSIVMTRRHLEHKTQQQAGDRTKNINTTHAIHGPSHQADKRVKHRHNYTSNPP